MTEGPAKKSRYYDWRTSDVFTHATLEQLEDIRIAKEATQEDLRLYEDYLKTCNVEGIRMLLSRCVYWCYV